jgi:hypothetical protein
MTNPKQTKLPEWMTGDVLDAWNNYFAVRKSKRLMVTDRIINNRIKRLELFRTYKPVLDLAKLIDRAAEGTGTRPWLEFHLPKDYRHEEKLVQARRPKPDSPAIERIKNELIVQTRRIDKLKSWSNPEERSLLIKLKRQLIQARSDARSVGDILDHDNS